MKRHKALQNFWFYTVLGVFWFSTPSVGSQPPTWDWEQRLQEILNASSESSSAESESRLRMLLSEATTRDQEAVAALALARLLTGGAAERQREADPFFEQAVKAGSGQHKLDARNVWGVALLRQKRYGEAVEVLRTLSDSYSLLQSVDTSTRARYLYNYAVALERTGQIRESISVYEQVLRLDPGLERAAEALVRLTFAIDSSGKIIPAPTATFIASMNALFGPMLDSGRTETAARYLKVLWGDRLIFGEHNQVFPRWGYWLIRYLTVARVSPDDFEREWLPWLKDTSPIGVRGSSWLHRIFEAYQADLAIVLERGPAQSLISPWSSQPETADAFSDLLLVVGDAFRAQGRSKVALSHYVLAWSSTGNWKAGAYLANFLQQASELDPQRRILSALVSASRETEMPPLDAGGWHALSRFHVLLAQDQQRRGATKESLDEWQRAVEAHERANILTSSKESAPGLYAGLGKANIEVGQQETGRRFLLKASQQYLEIGRPDLARAAIQGIEGAPQLDIENEKIDRSYDYSKGVDLSLYNLVEGKATCSLSVCQDREARHSAQNRAYEDAFHHVNQLGLSYSLAQPYYIAGFHRLIDENERSILGKEIQLLKSKEVYDVLRREYTYTATLAVVKFPRLMQEFEYAIQAFANEFGHRNPDNEVVFDVDYGIGYLLKSPGFRNLVARGNQKIRKEIRYKDDDTQEFFNRVTATPIPVRGYIIDNQYKINALVGSILAKIIAPAIPQSGYTSVSITCESPAYPLMVDIIYSGRGQFGTIGESIPFDAPMLHPLTPRIRDGSKFSFARSYEGLSALVQILGPRRNERLRLVYKGTAKKYPNVQLESRGLIFKINVEPLPPREPMQ